MYPMQRDAAVLEAWAKEQSADSLVDFTSAEGDAPSMLKELTARTGDKVRTRRPGEVARMWRRVVVVKMVAHELAALVVVPLSLGL